MSFLLPVNSLYPVHIFESECEAGSRSGEQMSWVWPVSHILTSLVTGSGSVQPRAEQGRVSLILSGDFQKTKLWFV